MEPVTRVALRLLTLWALAVAQPLYDLLGRNPAFFVYRRCEPADLFLFVIAVSLLLPAAAVAAPVAAARLLGRRGAAAVHLAAVFVLLAALLTPAIGRLGSLPAGLHLALGPAAAAALTFLFHASRGTRRFLLYLSPVLLLFPAIFLLRPAIRDQWWRPAVTAAASAAEARTVVLLVFDALPLTSLLDDRYQVDPVRYPSFARLASTSTWYRQARASAPNTELALPMILSGRCSDRERPPTYASYPHNLFTLLGAGYNHEVIETITDLCPPALCEEAAAPRRQRLATLGADTAVIFAHWLVPAPWSERLPSIETAWGGFLAGGAPGASFERGEKAEQVERLRAQFARIDGGKDRLLVFAHTLLPHNPFYFLPSGRRYRTDTEEPGGATSVFSDDEWVVRHSYQRHLLQLGFTDRLVGELIARLEQTGRWDDALVVVTADHGVSFRVNESRRSPTPGNAVDILPVPLFVKRPHQTAGEVVDLPVQSLDILPLMAEALGLPKPEWVEGRSRAELEDDPAARFPCHSASEIMTIEIPAAALAERVDELVSLFGTGSSGGRVPRIGPRPDLLGLPSRAACGPPAPVEIVLADERLFGQVDTTSDFVPAEIVGLVKGLPAGETVDLAVTVNGTVQATTRSYRYGAANASLWATIVPESSFVDGANRIEVFVANGPGRPCALSPTRSTAAEISYLGSRLGLWEVPGVTLRGFRKITLRRDRQVRWSSERGRIVVPLSEEEMVQVRELRIDLADLGPEAVQLRLSVNRQVVFEGEVTEEPWSGRFPVRVDQTPVVVILESNILRRGKRELGVALEGIWLSDGQGELDE